MKTTYIGYPCTLNALRVINEVVPPPDFQSKQQQALKELGLVVKLGCISQQKHLRKLLPSISR